MPIHDWTRVDAGVFHDFHQAWIVGICHALNHGRLPADFCALAAADLDDPAYYDPPRISDDRFAEAALYVRRADRIEIKYRLRKTIAVIEIISPGHKNSARAMHSFLEKAHDLIANHVNLLVVDLFPPSPWDPQGIHPRIFGSFVGGDFEMPADRPLTVVSYNVKLDCKEAFVEPLAVGDALPTMPIFLQSDIHVPVPLDEAYQSTWANCPDAVRELFDS